MPIVPLNIRNNTKGTMSLFLPDAGWCEESSDDGRIDFEGTWDTRHDAEMGFVYSLRVTVAPGEAGDAIWSSAVGGWFTSFSEGLVVSDDQQESLRNAPADRRPGKGRVNMQTVLQERQVDGTGGVLVSGKIEWRLHKSSGRDAIEHVERLRCLTYCSIDSVGSAMHRQRLLRRTVHGCPVLHSRLTCCF